MCGCETNNILLLYLISSLFVGIWHFSQWVDHDKNMLTLKDVDSIGMVIYYLLSIPSKVIAPIVMGTYKLLKLVLTCKFR